MSDNESELVSRHDERLEHVAAWNGVSPVDRDDIVQDTWERALRHRDQVPAADDHQRRWLGAITRNLARDRHRRSATSRRVDQRLAGHANPTPSGPEELAIAAEEARLARIALTRLGPEQQRVLVLRVVEGRPTAEVAALLGISVDAVRQRQLRAATAFRQALMAAGWDGEQR